MAHQKPTESTLRSPPIEGPKRRTERRQFFRGWITISAIGFVVVLAAALYATMVNDIVGVAAIATMTLMALLLLSGAIWLIRYIVVGRKRHELDDAGRERRHHS